MESLSAVDWSSLFRPSHSLAEMIVRGTLMYLALFVILRFAMKRQAGSVGMADILVIVVLADAAQNGFSDDYSSITEGLVLVLTIVFWNFAIDWLAYRFPRIGAWLEPSPITLVKNGKIIRRNLRREFITTEELQGHLRKAGVDRIESVKMAVMESDGEISVVPVSLSGQAEKGHRAGSG